MVNPLHNIKFKQTNLEAIATVLQGYPLYQVDMYLRDKANVYFSLGSDELADNYGGIAITTAMVAIGLLVGCLGLNLNGHLALGCGFGAVSPIFVTASIMSSRYAKKRENEPLNASQIGNRLSNAMSRLRHICSPDQAQFVHQYFS